MNGPERAVCSQQRRCRPRPPRLWSSVVDLERRPSHRSSGSSPANERKQSCCELGNLSVKRAATSCTLLRILLPVAPEESRFETSYALAWHERERLALVSRLTVKGSDIEPLRRQCPRSPGTAGERGRTIKSRNRNSGAIRRTSTSCTVAAIPHMPPAGGERQLVSIRQTSRQVL